MELQFDANLVSAINAFTNEYKFHIGGFLGLTTLTCFAALVFHISKLGVSGSNQQQRSEAMKGILISGVGLSVLGSLSFWFFLLISTNLIK